jgi:diguanylate cyclase (GGDEF)-like protein
VISTLGNIALLKYLWYKYKVMSHELAPSIEHRANPYAGVVLPYSPENTHELTGLPNRAALAEMLGFAVDAMPGNFGVIAMDLDGLKAINDGVGGHAAGDLYIKNAAGALREIMRSGDAIGVHLSGDEFVGVLPGVNKQSQLDGVIARVQPILDDLGVPTSMGGKIHTPGETPQEMMKAADALELRNKLIRKFNAHTSEQRNFALRVAEEALEKKVNVRDIPAIVASVALMLEMQEDSSQEG